MLIRFSARLSRPVAGFRLPPVALPGPSPVVGKPPQVKGPRPPPGVAAPARGAGGGACASHHPGLVRGQGQAVFPHALRQYRQQASGILCGGTDNGASIREAIEARLPAQSWLHLVRKPAVEHRVEIGSKDGALLHCWSTSPPSALRTGRATRRCTQLASDSVSQSTLCSKMFKFS
jgi:hypothetical protein